MMKRYRQLAFWGAIFLLISAIPVMGSAEAATEGQRHSPPHQLTNTPTPQTEILTFFTQITPGTARWSEINAELTARGLTPGVPMVLKDGVSLYEVSINRLSGVETYPYSQRIDASMGVRDNTIAYVWLTIVFDNNPSPDSPEWAFASPQTIFNRYGVPDHFRASVRSTESGIASTITAYWQSSGLLIVYGLELYPYDQNGSTLQLCLTPDRSTSIYLVKTLPGTGESEIGTITGPLLRLRAPLTADMFLEAPNIAGVIGKLISGECLKTLDSYWFSLDPSYPTVTPWATDTPRPVATNAPTKTPTATDIPTTISTAIRHNLRIILYNRHRAGCDFPVGEKCCQQNRNILIQ